MYGFFIEVNSSCPLFGGFYPPWEEQFVILCEGENLLDSVMSNFQDSPVDMTGRGLYDPYVDFVTFFQGD